MMFVRVFIGIGWNLFGVGLGLMVGLFIVEGLFEWPLETLLGNPSGDQPPATAAADIRTRQRYGLLDARCLMLREVVPHPLCHGAADDRQTDMVICTMVLIMTCIPQRKFGG